MLVNQHRDSYTRTDCKHLIHYLIQRIFFVDDRSAVSQTTLLSRAGEAIDKQRLRPRTKYNMPDATRYTYVKIALS